MYNVDICTNKKLKQKPLKTSLIILTVGLGNLRSAARELYNGGNPAICSAARELYNGGTPAVLVEHDPSELRHKAGNIINVLDELKIPKVNAITQSEGTITTAMAALQAPERFNTLIFEAPAGLSGKDSTGRLIGRFALKTGIVMTWDLIRHPVLASNFLSGSSRYIAKDMPKILSEVRGIANTQINDTLVKLRQAGVRVGVIQSRADRGFSHKKIYGQLVHENGEDLELNVDAYASIANRWAGHDHIIFDAPQAIKAALQMIDNLKENK
ncbi:hypothetical protein HYS84_02775 [Candidatus Saccharibacteria bacterium]|nr:hypothetical protein [Candidatus Saccharibacteria bacterium]